MKRLLIMMAALTTGLFAACTGNENGGGVTNDEVLVLKVDKEVIDLDKSEKATFTVELDGKDVTADAEIIEVSGGMYKILPTNVYSTLRPGFHSFFATVGDKSSEVIAIEGLSEKGLSDTFYRRNLMMKFTGTWCSSCPAMSTTIKQAQKIYPDRIIEVAAHSGDDLANDTSDEFNKHFGIQSLPTVMVDFNKDYQTGNRVASQLVELSQKSLEENPTVVGIKAATVMGGDNLLTVDVEMTIVEAGNYKVAVYPTKSGFNLEQSGTADVDYRQNHVIQGHISENIMGDVLVEGGCVNGEVVKKQFTEQFSSSMTDEDKDNYRIVVVVLNEIEAGVYTVNNAVELELNETQDYKYEPLDSIE